MALLILFETIFQLFCFIEKHEPHIKMLKSYFVCVEIKSNGVSNQNYRVAY